MSARVRIPIFLRSVIGEEWIHVHGSTVGAVLGELQGLHPDIESDLMDGSGLRRYVNVYVNERNIRFAEGLNTAVRDGDTVMILPVERPRLA